MPEAASAPIPVVVAGSVEISSFKGQIVNDETKTLSFPSVELLVNSTLPFVDSEQLVERLVSTWCDALLLDECALLWHRSFSRTGELAYTNRNRDYRRSKFSAGPEVNKLSNHALVDLPQSANWDWVQLLIDDVPIGCVGFSPQQPIQLPTGWSSTTARLLSTAMVWELNLNDRKLDALGEYAAGAGHEINNPLAAIGGRAAQLLQHEADPHRRHLLETIGAQTYRIRDLIGDSMLFARPPALHLSEFNLTDLIETVVHQFSEEFREHNISLWGQREAQVQCRGDERQIAVVISELLRNALNAVQDKDRIEIDCRTDCSNSQQVAVLRISDNGTGLTALDREHCFDPFYSGREAGRGLGFGLSKCWRIVTLHHGEIRLEDARPGMTEFLITLPVSD